MPARASRSDEPSTPSGDHLISRSAAVQLILVGALLVSVGVVPVSVVATPEAAHPTQSSQAAETANASTPRIAVVFPDPIAANDSGEYVVVETAGAPNLTLEDGESIVKVPADGRAALSSSPNATRALVEGRVTSPGLDLSNAGERLVLRQGGVVVDRVHYARAREGKRLNATTDRWTPRGLQPRRVVSTGAATATAFVLPDAPQVAIETLRSAETRILLAGYTFASSRMTDALLAANRRGVSVRVLLEGGPIGGMTTAQRAQLDRLVAGGVEVRVIDGPHARFTYHHAKYAVVDDQALVLTENWKPAGTGGHDSRGWGVRVDSTTTAAELADVFAHDANWMDAVPWRAARRNATFVEAGPASGSYDSDFDPARVEIERIRLLTAPENAGTAVRQTIHEADNRVWVLSPRLDAEGPYFASLVDAARRGVRVRILLSNAWYDAESNRAVVERTATLRERGVPIEARIARPVGRFGKVHAKGAIVDGDTVLIGSLNWNQGAERRNREVVLALSGSEPAAYYGQTFDADWNRAGESAGPVRSITDRRVQVTMVLGALAALMLAGVVLRQVIEFE
ncbi:MAG: phospholipase D-like domain-containing protein [Halobellus sp.]|uniref:phospholipase D-like domain-containing protein n=1 Tax=Halobellus sp. TaxID=1979212 RepID=UPI0035D49CD9